MCILSSHIHHPDLLNALWLSLNNEKLAFKDVSEYTESFMSTVKPRKLQIGLNFLNLIQYSDWRLFFGWRPRHLKKFIIRCVRQESVFTANECNFGEVFVKLSLKSREKWLCQVICQAICDVFNIKNRRITIQTVGQSQLFVWHANSSKH